MSGCSTDSLSPATTQGVAITRLFTAVLGISAVVFIMVAGVLVYAIVRFRARGTEAEPPQIHGNRHVEIAWTAAPLVLLAILFVPTLRTMASVDAPSTATMRVEVIGHQWWWEYRYTDLGFTTANELHLPVGQTVRLDLDAADVIHSFWVPQFGWKRDAIPGKSNALTVQLDEPGVFEGACSEYCGLQHAWMRIRVVGESDSDFNRWAETQKLGAAPADTDVRQRGQQLFEANTCVECHTIRGTSAAGQAGPELTHVGSRATLASGVLDNNPTTIARFVRDPSAFKPGALMPSFSSFSEADISAIAAYLTGLK